MRQTLLREPHPQTKKREPPKREPPKKRATKSKAKGAHDDDSVGVDEEGIYSDTNSLVAASDSIYDSDLAASSDFCDDCSDPKFNPDGKVVVVDDEYDPPPFSYDVDNPCIDVNVVFLDVDQCKSAVTHHAIMNDHAFEIVKRTRVDLEPYAREQISVATGSFLHLQVKSTLAAR
jgi:hypothetical protein